MKKTLTIIFCCGILFISGSPVFAQTDESSPSSHILGATSSATLESTSAAEYLKKLNISSLSAEQQFSFLGLPKPLILPDSPFYILVSWYEKIRLFLTFSPEAKANFALSIAERRLAESYKLTEKGNAELAQKSLQAYQDSLANLSERVQINSIKGLDVSQLVRLIEANIIKEQTVKDFFSRQFETTKTVLIGKVQTLSAENLEKVLNLIVSIKESTPSYELQNKVKDIADSNAISPQLKNSILTIWQENFESSESAKPEN